MRRASLANSHAWPDASEKASANRRKMTRTSVPDRNIAHCDAAFGDEWRDESPFPFVREALVLIIQRSRQSFPMYVHVYIYIYTNVCICMYLSLSLYIYIYIYREREREVDIPSARFPTVLYFHDFERGCSNVVT